MVLHVRMLAVVVAVVVAMLSGCNCTVSESGVQALQQDQEAQVYALPNQSTIRQVAAVPVQIGNTGMYTVITTNGNLWLWSVTPDPTLKLGDLVREIYIRVPRATDNNRHVDVVVRSNCTTQTLEKK